MAAEGNPESYKLLTEESIRAALESDRGPEAELLSWKIQDFTKKGDNYACFVTSVQVRFRLGGEEEERATSYVAKLNPRRANEGLNEMIGKIFYREGTVFTKVIPAMNQILSRLGCPPIAVAKCFFCSLEESKEVLILEDLRPRGFKMWDRRRGIDATHARLVLQEIGRFHAASLLLESELPGKDILRTYSLDDHFMSSETTKKTFSEMASCQLEGTAHILEKIPKYERVCQWLHKTKDEYMDMFIEMLDPANYKPPFFVLNHGDCWNNNLLFRYDDTGSPVQVMLVDLQVVRKVSPALDLNYFLYSSFNGPVRKQNLEEFLKVYHDAFCHVMSTGGFEQPFSVDQLRDEFRDKMLFGCLSGMMLIPIVLSEDEDVVDFDVKSDEDMEKFKKDRQKVLLDMSQREDGMLKPRLFDMLDEMIEFGIIS
ncbi:uncharacterized protein LOC125041686 [Penaeus chinensis]|uniref:uncharacterized protein LOC125041686 n=1 Tax=Penaeus chinensis TaxID=139456 RepID=UPI001FB6B480|nr:uncharacterized protein LOC125041686 [Penaeus chinensis]